MSIFKKKKEKDTQQIYTLHFQKAKIINKNDDRYYREVLDSSLMQVLLFLQQKYHFKIMSVLFDTYYMPSYIKIKCNKDAHIQIFAEYVTLLNNKITSVNFQEED